MTTNKILRAWILTGIFLIPFVMIIYSGSILFPSTFFPFITGKNFTFRILVELIAGAWLILALRDPKNYAPKKSWLIWAMASFLVVMALADAFSANPLKSFWSNFERMEGYVTIAHLALYFLVAGTMLNSEKLWNWFWHTSIGVSVFICLYGVLQINGQLPIDQGSTRIDSTLGNSAYLAVYVLIHAFILLYFLLSPRFSAHPRSSLRNILISYAIGLGSFAVYYISKFSQLGARSSGTILLTVAILGFLGALWMFFVTPADARSGGLTSNSGGHTRHSDGHTAHSDARTSASLPTIQSWTFYLTIALYAILFILEVFTMIETATRGSALGFIVGILFMATAFAFFERKRLMIRNVGIAVLVITVLAIGGIFALKNSPVIKNSASLSRLSTLATTNFAQFADTEGAARFQIWKMALKGAEQRPILGWGQESFNYLFYKYYSPAMYTQEPWFDRAHDVFLDWLTAGGVLGLLTYLSLFYFTLWYIWKKKVVMSSSGKDVSASMDFSEKITLTALLIAYFIHNIFVFDNIASYIMFFSLLAYIQYRYSVSFGFVSKSKSEAKAVVTKTISLSASDTSDENDGVSSETVKMVAAVLIGIATLAGGYYINVPAIHASMLLVDALSPQQNLEQNLSIYKQIFALPTFIGKYEAREQLTQLAIQIETATSAQVPDATKVDIVNYAYSQMQEQLKETPNDLRYYYFMGELLNTYGQFQGALPVWQKAVELSPNRQLMLISLGEVQEQLGDSTDAIANFKKAYMLDTDYSDAAEIYFQAAGLYSQLVTLMQQQIASDPTNVNDYFTLAQAYDGLKDKTDALAALNQIITINPTLASQMQTYITEAKTGKPLQ